MDLEGLSQPLPGELAVGEDCEREIHAQNFLLMTEYLVERALQKGRDRAAERSGLEDGEARNADAVRDEGRRKLISLEGILKDVMKVTNINVEQVSKVVRDKACALLAQRGKDLRLMPHLCVAVVAIDGLPGYLAALKLASALLQAYPKDLHPLPDEGDPPDFWQRVNSASELVSGDDLQAVLGAVVVLDGKQSGRITLAELVGGLRGDLPVAEVAQSDLTMALNEVGAERVQQLIALFGEIEACIASLVFLFDAGALTSPRLSDVFRRATGRVANFADGGPGVGPISPTEPQLALPNVGVSGKPESRGDLLSREDARRVILDVIRFIEKIEPSHPAPLLLKRAHRLLGMGFVDIIKDMAPSGLSEIEKIAGAEPSN